MGRVGEGFTFLKPPETPQKAKIFTFWSFWALLPHPKIFIYFFLNTICFSKVFLHKEFENLTKTEVTSIWLPCPMKALFINLMWNISLRKS